MEFQVILSIMVQMFILLMVGYSLKRFGLIDEETNQKLSNLVAQVTCPILIFSSVLSSSTEDRMSILIVLCLGFFMYLVLIIFAKAVATLFRYPPTEKPLYENMLIFSNIAFMSFPVIQSILGTEAIFYTAMLHFPNNLFIFSYTIISIEKCKDPTNDKMFDFKYMKKCINPGFILSIVALIIYLAGIRTNGVLYKTCLMIGNTTPPLSMFILGYSLTKYPILKAFTNWRNYLFTSIRVLVIPILSFYCCKILGVSQFYTIIVTLTNGMPVAAMVLILANQAGVDTKVVVENLFLSYVLATFTVPIIGAIFL